MKLRIYVLRRLLMFIPSMLFITFLVFMIIQLAPGDIAEIILRYRSGGSEHITTEMREWLINRYSLDKPLHIQFLNWLWHMFQGDFGYSIMYYKPVTQIFAERWFNSFKLMFIAQAISIPVAIILGVYTSVNRYSKTDNLLTIISLFGWSIPSFWLSIISILIFGVYLGIVPTHGMYTLTGEAIPPLEFFLDQVHHIILPVAILLVSELASIFRLVRSSMLDVLHKDYITTARAKGVREFIVIYKHALRNALLPVVTVIGMRFGIFFAGAAIIEQIFAWPGLGYITIYSAIEKDFTLTLGMTTIVAILIMIGNLCADVVCAYLDPSIEY